jgi:hypothetical protein
MSTAVGEPLGRRGRKDAISTLTEIRLWPTETYCCSRCFAPAAMRDGTWGHVDPVDDAVCRVTGLIRDLSGARDGRS